MRTAPSISRFVHFPVTAGIGLMAVGVTIAWMSKQSIGALQMNALAFEGEPWRILTSALPHVDLLHLIFNLMWMWALGAVIEETWGALRTLAIFALFTVTSALGEYALFIGGVGLSGVVYGLWGMLVVLGRRDPQFAGIVSRRTNILFVAWFFICIVLTVTDVMAIGNVAHGVGAVTGVLLGVALCARTLVARIAGGAGIALVIAATLLGASMFRPQVNLSRYGGSDSAVLGYEQLKTDDAAAVRHLRRALEINPADAASWFNLGGALERTGSAAEGLLALRMALALDPTDREYRERVAGKLAELAVAQSKAADYATAIPLYRESAGLVPTVWSTWFNLSLALARSGDDFGAVDAARKAHALAASAQTREWLADALVRAGMRAQKDAPDRAGALFREADQLREGASPAGSGSTAVPR